MSQTVVVILSREQQHERQTYLDHGYEIIPISRACSGMLSRCDLVYVRADPSDLVSSNYQMTEDNMGQFYTKLHANSTQVVPDPTLTQAICLKRYALDLAVHMHPGTLVFDLMAPPEQWARQIQTMFEGGTTWRLKPALCNTGRGHGKVTTPASIRRFLFKHRKRVPSGVVIAQPNLTGLLEQKYLCTFDRLHRHATQGDRPETWVFAQRLFTEVVLPFMQTQGPLPGAWRMDVMIYNNVHSLQEIEVVGANFNFIRDPVLGQMAASGVVYEISQYK